MCLGHPKSFHESVGVVAISFEFPSKYPTTNEHVVQASGNVYSGFESQEPSHLKTTPADEKILIGWRVSM